MVEGRWLRRLIRLEDPLARTRFSARKYAGVGWRMPQPAITSARITSTAARGFMGSGSECVIWTLAARGGERVA